MVDRNLTELVKAEVLSHGMDLVGFAPVDRWKNAPFLLSPQAILPGCKTVVVGGIHITDTWTEMGGEPEPQDRSPGGWMDQNSLLDRIAFRVARFLSDRGHRAIGVASSNIWRYREFPGVPSLFAPDLSHIHAATAAGLAEIGWSGLAITPEFGSRVRYISIVTDAELTPTPMYSGPKLCDMCMECVKHCPTAAMRKELKAQPHTVEIGGKTYKYANKNMWRCAWAEHFNLDLNSENLKKMDHVGEKEILQETAENGRRGHERGVCQKVCVPPHLRTKQPSFGRPDKLIAQNRINRRYPESMPTLRKMRDDLIALAVRCGADLAAVGPLAADSPAGQLALKDAPGGRTVLAFAFRMPPEVREVMANPQKYGDDVRAPYHYGFDRLMHHLLLRVARQVEDYGYHASSYTGTHDPKGGDADAFAAMAGLGEVVAQKKELNEYEKRSESAHRIAQLDTVGRLKTPEFGQDVFVGAVVTDAPLDATSRVEGKAEVSTPRVRTPKQLRSELERLAGQNLVSLFGVADPAAFDNLLADLKANINEQELGEWVYDSNQDYHGPYVPKVERRVTHLRHPKDLLPSAKSVIVLGMHLPREVLENAGLSDSQQVGTYGFHQYQTCFELRIAASQLAKHLSERGYRVYASENLTGLGSQVDGHRGLLPDARCNALEAVAAGLGEIGQSGALLTPEHGPNQRRIVLVTDAELPADQPVVNQHLCTDCGACESKCPMSAFEKGTFKVRVGAAKIEYPKIKRHRCDWSKKYALCKEEGPALIGNKTDVPTPAGEITIDTIAAALPGRDPIMKRRPCILESCLRFCPAGKAVAAEPLLQSAGG